MGSAPEIIADLDSLTETEMEQDGKRFVLRSAPRPAASLALRAAGVAAGAFGMMNLFARALGGIVSDRSYIRWGLRGRAMLLVVTVALEGIAFVCFSQARWLPLAIAAPISASAC